MEANSSAVKSKNFIEEIIDGDLQEGKNEGRVITRFPPEPNGYLHIGHAKSICLNFGLAAKYNGKCNLRFDDTNPCAEESEYVESIKEDIRWLGFDWEDREFFASDYFETFYDWAVKIIKKGKAYVCELPQEKISEFRGVPTRPGKESPYRDRSIEKNLELFEAMKNGEYPGGSMVLRAKIDMSSPNMHLRDPIMYRIIKVNHHRTEDKWCIYPTYDFAHGESDYIEGITHSICTLEFEVHRPLYDWFLEQIRDKDYRPRQIEFARLNLTYTVMSKRKLMELVRDGVVEGWDDPRMPTISGLRRRGYTPESIRDFSERIGVAKRESMVDIALLEHCLREDLNKRADRVMAVLKPLKIVIINYPENKVEKLTAVNNPEDTRKGTREIIFSKTIYIEQEDFMEDPPKKFFRLAPGREVRLRYGYFIKCCDVIKDENENILEVHCTYDPETKGGSAPDNRKVKATLHWVSEKNCFEAEVRMYSHLFSRENMNLIDEDKTYKDYISDKSLIVLNSCKLENSLQKAEVGRFYQFERQGYFCLDSKLSDKDNFVFNRSVPLKDEWNRIKNKKN